eukprot:jgi/Mesvir1/5529/Mv24081-RA.1
MGSVPISAVSFLPLPPPRYIFNLLPTLKPVALAGAAGGATTTGSSGVVAAAVVAPPAAVAGVATLTPPPNELSIGIIGTRTGCATLDRAANRIASLNPRASATFPLAAGALCGRELITIVFLTELEDLEETLVDVV